MPINPSMMGSGSLSYYNQPQMVPRQLPDVDNVLFVADLPEEACEEDLANFFRAYNFSFAKVFQ